jgi:hypothetical protein
LLLLVSSAWAQAPGELTLRELTARPVWREVGQTYDLQVRFITNIPAVAAGELTGVPAAEPEKYAGNNHRLDFPAVPVGPARTLKLTVTALDKTSVERTLAINGPAPPPAVAEGRVNLEIVEPAGRDRRGLPVTSGVPLPKGALFVANNAQLKGLPLQARAQSRWEDGSIKWLLVDTQIDLKANEKAQLALLYGGRQQAIPPANPLRVTELSGRGGVAVSSGALEATLPAGGEAEFKGLGRLSSQLTDVTGRAYDLVPEAVTVLEAGSLRTVVRVEGRYRVGDAQHFRGSLLVTFFAGKPYARVDHVFGNDIMNPPVPADPNLTRDMVPIKSLVVDLTTGPGGNATVGVVGGGPVTAPAGSQWVQQFDDKFVGAATGRRLAGWIKTERVALAVKDFWQQYPKSLAVTADSLSLGLCPPITPADLYANKPEEEKLYYYLRDGNYTFRRGLRKRHEMWLGPAAEAEEVAALAARHAVLSADPSYYEMVQAAGTNLPRHPEQFAMFDEILSTGIDSYLEGRERDREYGLMNWGDWFGERRLNWGNIEYDLQVGMLQQFLRTGDRRFFSLGEAAARHNTDIDTIHWAPEPTRLPDQRYEPFPGQIWVHSMGHTGGYYPRNYQDMEIYSVGYATNRGHMWVGGNFLYGMLTGDPLVLEAARLSADWMAGPNCNNFDFGNAREPGWMSMAVMSAYRATRDAYYLNAADIMLTKTHEKAQATRPEYGLLYHPLPRGHCDCPEGERHHGEAGFMAGVLMTGMKRFYEETGREQVANDIVGIARFIVETMWVPEENGFRYTSCPKTGVGASSGGIICEGLAFAANRTNNEELREIVRLSFANAMLALKSTGGGGKSAGYLLHSMPGVMTEMGKFPGQPFNKFFEQQLAESRSSALATLPTLMPNPDFEEGAVGWVTRTGFTVNPSPEAAHSGRLGALVTGTGKAQNEYLVTRYACGPPWEIMALQPGKQYRLSAWVKVNEITPGTPPVNLRCAIRDGAVTRTAFQTSAYDPAKMGTWQRLSGEFTAPDYTQSAYVAVNMNTRETVTINLCVDDVNITAIESPDLPLYSYPAVTVEQAQLSGGLALTTQRRGPAWQLAALSGRAPGSAVFKLQVTEAGAYRLWLRGRGLTGSGQVTVTCNGQPAGVAVASENFWQWLPAMSGDKPVVLDLKAGEQTLQLTWPAGSRLGVQKIILSNDLHSR